MDIKMFGSALIALIFQVEIHIWNIISPVQYGSEENMYCSLEQNEPDEPRVQGVWNILKYIV